MKELKPTQELIDLYNEMRALRKCCEISIRLVFRTKTAIKYAKKAEKIRHEFWRLSGELHPEIKKGAWGYNTHAQIFEEVK